MRTILFCFLCLLILCSFTLASETKSLTVHKANSTGEDILTIRYKMQNQYGTWVTHTMTVPVPIPKNTLGDAKAQLIDSKIGMALKVTPSSPFSCQATNNAVTITANPGVDIVSMKSTNNTHQVGNETVGTCCESGYQFVVMDISGYASGYTEDGYPAYIHVGSKDMNKEAFAFTYAKNVWEVLNELQDKLNNLGIKTGVYNNSLFFFCDGSISFGCNDKTIIQSLVVIDTYSLLNMSLEEIKSWDNLMAQYIHPGQLNAEGHSEPRLWL